MNSSKVQKHSPNEKLSRVTIITILTIILVLGSFLRFYKLGKESLWNDELETWRISSYKDLSDVLKKGILPDVHPPAYQIGIFFIEKYVGDTAAALRLLSVVAGIISMIAIFFLAKRLYSHKEGLIASALVAFLWCPIYYSQEARSYSILLLASILSTHFWIKIVQDLDEKSSISYKSVFVYILVSILTCYIHYFGLYLVALQGLGILILFIRRRKELLFIFLIYLLILIAYLPWFPYFLEDLSIKSTYIPNPTIKSFYLFMAFLFNQSRLVFIVGLLCFSMFLCALKNFLREKRSINRKVFLSSGIILLLWLIVPFIGIYIKSVISVPVLTVRNLIISLPAAYILLARSIIRLPIRSIGHVAVTTCLIVVFLFHLAFHKQYYTRAHKEQFREAVSFIVDNDVGYQNSMVIGFAWDKEYFNYYFKIKGSARKIDILAGTKEDISRTKARIAMKNPSYVWFIRAHRNPDKEFTDFLNQELVFVSKQNFIEADVWLFKN